MVRATAMSDAEKRELRQQILDTAMRIMGDVGAHGLSMRRLATEVGFSTMVLYNFFRDKEEIVAALYLRGFTELGEELKAVRRFSDARRHIEALGHAYRRFALRCPACYQLMFGAPVKEFTPDQDCLEKSYLCMEVLTAAVIEGQKQGLFIELPVEMLVLQLWSAVHGMVSLELRGYFETRQDATAAFEIRVETALRGLLRQPD
ncbi:MAG: TetR/AcrR family transcriptional regulator [bacterium]